MRHLNMADFAVEALTVGPYDTIAAPGRPFRDARAGGGRRWPV